MSQNLIRSLFLSTLKHKDFINHFPALAYWLLEKFFWLIPVSSVAGDEQLPATCFFRPNLNAERKYKKITLNSNTSL
ncbi:hypothetical protein A4D02_20385 [Niastella koreensis]|uniref:Uncharacterized protein n=1 Tax=Niastella koreensis TaxID=354356 RepID=A0ABX3P473_9BACT|nr:hypothetical protein A4D02_20385 [Niastella koreensis]